MAVHQWAQTWFGTWRIKLSEFVSRFNQPSRALALFHAMETVRLDTYIAQELPGLYRDMQQLRDVDPQQTIPAAWEKALNVLQNKKATVNDSVCLVEDLYSVLTPPAPACYQGQLFPDRTEAVNSRRQAHDKLRLQQILGTS